MQKLTARAKAAGSINNLIRRNPLYYRRIMDCFDLLADASLEDRQQWTANRIQQVLQYAATTSYGKRLGGTDGIESWPLLEKDLVRSDPDAFRPALTGFAIPASTSGSSGSPLRLRRSLMSIVAEQVTIDRILIAKGVNPRKSPIAILRGDSIKDPSDFNPPYWQFADGGNRLLLSSHHLSEATIGHYVKILQEFSPTCLMAYPSSLEWLCGFLLEKNIRLNIPMVLASSEMLSPLASDFAKKALNSDVVNTYGLAERVAYAISFKEGEYYFQPGYGYIELEYIRSGEDGDVYEIVGSSLWNYTMPLIRYKTGDYLRCSKGLSKAKLTLIRYGLLPFDGIEGRSTDYLISPEGSRIIGINQIPRDIENVIQMQFIAESRERVRLLVIPTKEYSEHDGKKIMRNVHSKFPRSMKVTLELAEKLERTTLGKAPFIIRRETSE